MTDRIYLEDLEVHCIIGVNDWERMVKQPVHISYEIPYDVSRPAKTDDVEQAVNYRSISKWMIDYVETSEFYLVETLADRMARECVENFDLDEITLSVEKPGAVRHSQTVGVEVTRSRDGS